MLHLRFLQIVVLVSLCWEVASPWQPWPVPPRDIMADITNDLGICLLQVIGRDSRENIAFSPYGVMSVVFLLYEGSHGNTAIEIYNSLRLPWDRHMSRIGFRDLHRHIKSYFSNDRFLKGLVLSKPSVPLKSEYVRLLNFYGFYPNREGIPPPESTTYYNLPEDPSQEEHEGRNPHTTTYYPYPDTTHYPETTKIPWKTTSGPLTTPHGYTINTNTPSTFATFPNFESEPTIPPFEPTKSRTKTTQTYTTADRTTVRPSRRTTTMSPYTLEEMSTVKPGYNGHGMTQFFTHDTPTEAVPTGNDDYIPSVEDNIITHEEYPKQTTKSQGNGITDPFTEIDFGYTSKQTTITQPTTEDNEEEDTPIIFPQGKDNIPTESEHKQTEKPDHDSTIEEGPIVYPTDSTTALGGSSDIDIRRLEALKKRTTITPDNTEFTSTSRPETTPMTKGTNGKLISLNLITSNQDTTQTTDSVTEATDRKTTQNNRFEERTTMNAEIIDTIDPKQKNGRIIMTRKDVETANKMVDTMDKTTMQETLSDIKPTLATILSTIATNIDNRNDIITNKPTESELKTTPTEQTTETTEKVGTDPEKITTQYSTTPRPTTINTAEPSTTVMTESTMLYTNLRMPISIEMATNNPLLTDALSNRTSGNSTEQKENAGRTKRAIIPPSDYGYDHRDGSTNWIPAAQGPHWEYSIPRDQWFYTYSGSEPVQVLTYKDYLPFAFIESIDTMALQLPLDDPRYSMLLLLPMERYGLEQLLASLHQCSIRDILQSLRVAPIYAVIPAFTLVKHINIVPALELMGIEEVFDPSRADLSGMAEEPHLYVRSIEQLVTVSLRKYHYSSRRFDGPPEEIRDHFIANHPFVYFVLDTETNAALMTGTVVNPTECRPPHNHLDR